MDLISLLGMDLIEALHLQMQGSSLVNTCITTATPTASPDPPIPTHIFNRFGHMFTPGLGTVKGYELKVKMKENTIPVQSRLRRLPFDLRPVVDKELDRLEHDGIIEPIDASEWISPLSVASTKSGKIRLCIDMRKVNEQMVIENSLYQRLMNYLQNLMVLAGLLRLI
ncbi:hypothetical protein SNE40_001070 [Patella caerulea]|uniref:Uncharacterized protein n=1 Tax=Patella caerulea TaxID=87958 RepID=A0AAN8KIK7_PATCE